MSILVVKNDLGFIALPVAHRLGEWTLGGTAKQVSAFITVHQESIAAIAADHVLPQVAGQALRSIVPEKDLAITAGHIHRYMRVFHYILQNRRLDDIQHAAPIVSSAPLGRALGVLTGRSILAQ